MLFYLEIMHMSLLIIAIHVLLCCLYELQPVTQQCSIRAFPPEREVTRKLQFFFVKYRTRSQRSIQICSMISQRNSGQIKAAETGARL